MMPPRRRPGRASVNDEASDNDEGSGNSEASGEAAGEKSVTGARAPEHHLVHRTLGQQFADAAQAHVPR